MGRRTGAAYPAAVSHPCKQEPDMSDDSSEIRQPNGRFAKGNPGGPGRPRAVERVLEFDQRVADAAPELIDAALQKAQAGNLKAIEMLLDRIWPVRRGRPVQLEVPEIRTTADLLPVGAALTNSVLDGEMTPEEGSAAARVLVAHARMIEDVDIDRRVWELENEAKRERGGK
jgi:hypothetical protein